MGFISKKEVENKKGKIETVYSFDFNPVVNWFNKLIGNDSETIGRASFVRQDELKEKLKDLTEIRLNGLAEMEKTTVHTHVFDANGICYQCGFQMRNTTEGNGQGGSQTRNTIKVMEDIKAVGEDSKVILEKLRAMVDLGKEDEDDEFTKILENEVDNIDLEAEPEEIDFDVVEITEGIRFVLDSAMKSSTLEEKAKSINAFYRTLTDVDGKLQVVHYLYEKMETFSDKERNDYLSAINKAGMKEESDILDTYLINNINECIRILTEVW